MLKQVVHIVTTELKRVKRHREMNPNRKVSDRRTSFVFTADSERPEYFTECNLMLAFRIVCLYVLCTDRSSKALKDRLPSVPGAMQVPPVLL
jgi:hypothetical protein